MKLVFFGTGSFAVPALEALAPNVVLAVSQPDRPSGRGLKMHTSQVKDAALRLGIQVETPEKARDLAFVERIRSLNADALVVASYGQILSEALLNAATRGGINLHGSILPKYRGAAPIQRCILDGEKETGVTLMQMDRGMDTGDLIAIEKLDIGPDETSGELQDRLAVLAADMAKSWMPRITAGDYPRAPQDFAQASMAPKIEKSEAELDFERDAQEEYNRFRAFTPGPGAFVRTVAGFVKISKARLANGHGDVGMVVAGGEGCLVAFADGLIDLIEVQPEGRKRMSGKDFLNGAHLRPGVSLR